MWEWSVQLYLNVSSRTAKCYNGAGSWSMRGPPSRHL